MMHGHGEHIQRYNHWAELFNGSNIGFTGVDLPGHGRSDGKRGHVRDGALLNEMIDILINECNKTFYGMPVFLYGHSLGGVIVLDYMLKRNPKIKGAIVTAPTLRLAFEPGKVKLMLAAIMKNILPGLIQPTGLPVEYLSHDREIVEKYVNDPLVHGKMSVSLFYAMMNASDYSLSHASELKVPLLLVHGGDDKICSPKGSIEFAGKTGMAELKIWERSFHELHNEPFKKEVFDFIMNWINKKLVL
jgi:alpha-beta hydrolase superfamily lysophospholipase